MGKRGGGGGGGWGSKSEGGGGRAKIIMQQQSTYNIRKKYKNIKINIVQNVGGGAGTSRIFLECGVGGGGDIGEAYNNTFGEDPSK